MFFLSQLEHKLRLPPQKLAQHLEDAIKGELQSLFVDKVIGKLGLCVSVYDISSIDGGFVLPNDGAPTYTVVFRVIMFRPYVGEVIEAKLKGANPKGLILSLGFFDDIHIPSYNLPVPSRTVPQPENSPITRWIWDYGQGEEDDFYIEGDEIRFRVTNVDYPPIPLEQAEGSKPFAPMVITGSMSEEGLGPLSWWV